MRAIKWRKCGLACYDEKFFERQRKTGEFAAVAELYKFQKYIKPSDNVIDFGCGGGFMLKSLSCSAKIGVEINNAARDFAHENGIPTVRDSSEIEDEWADVIISDNALEHTLSPFDELKKLSSKLKPGGKIVFVVPHEKKMPWKPNDTNQHLYTWSPLCIGNLFVAAGFRVAEISNLPVWPPGARPIWRYFGFRVFFMTSKIYTALSRQWSQIRIVATKPVY
jgi:SAM-dependent methyltransferase